MDKTDANFCYLAGLGMTAISVGFLVNNICICFLIIGIGLIGLAMLAYLNK